MCKRDKKEKSGRGLGDRGECARCRNGDLIPRRNLRFASYRLKRILV